MKEKFTVKKIALLGVLTACSLITFLIESLFPSILIPGAKLGISNVFVLWTLVLLGGMESAVVLVVKTVLGGLIVGNPFGIVYGLTAGAVALTVEWVLLRFCYPKVSIVAISVVGAVLHNAVQTILFCLITDTPEFFAYMRYLALIGVLSGGLVGLITYLLIKKIPNSVFEKILITTKKIGGNSESEER